MRYYNPSNISVDNALDDPTQVRDGLGAPIEKNEFITVGTSPRTDGRQIFKLQYLPLKAFAVSVTIAGTAQIVDGWRYDVAPITGHVGVCFERGLIEVPTNATGILNVVYKAGGSYLDAQFYAQSVKTLSDFYQHKSTANIHCSSLNALTSNNFLYNNGILSNTNSSFSVNQAGAVVAANLSAAGTISGASLNGPLTHSATSVGYTQTCSVSGMPKIRTQTPVFPTGLEMGEILTSGTRCSLLQNGNLTFANLGTTDIYLNPMNGNSNGWATAAWSGNTAFFELDTAAETIAAPTYVYADPFPRLGAQSAGDKRIKILVAGRYKIKAWARYQTNPATNANYYLRILKNRLYRGWFDSPRTYGGYPILVYNAWLDCAAGDLISMEFNTAGIAAVEFVSASLEIEKIG